MSVIEVKPYHLHEFYAKLFEIIPKNKHAQQLYEKSLKLEQWKIMQEQTIRQRIVHVEEEDAEVKTKSKHAVSSLIEVLRTNSDVQNLKNLLELFRLSLSSTFFETCQCSSNECLIQVLKGIVWLGGVKYLLPSILSHGDPTLKTIAFQIIATFGRVGPLSLPFCCFTTPENVNDIFEYLECLESRHRYFAYINDTESHDRLSSVKENKKKKPLTPIPSVDSNNAEESMVDSFSPVNLLVVPRRPRFLSTLTLTPLSNSGGSGAEDRSDLTPKAKDKPEPTPKEGKKKTRRLSVPEIPANFMEENTVPERPLSRRASCGSGKYSSSELMTWEQINYDFIVWLQYYFKTNSISIPIVDLCLFYLTHEFDSSNVPVARALVEVSNMSDINLTSPLEAHDFNPPEFEPIWRNSDISEENNVRPRNSSSSICFQDVSLHPSQLVIINSRMLYFLLNQIKTAPAPVLIHALEQLTYLFLSDSSNVRLFITLPKWQATLLNLLLYKEFLASQEKQIVRLVLNLYVVVFHYFFTHTVSFNLALSENFAAIKTILGVNFESQLLLRLQMYSLICKVHSHISIFMLQPSHCSWQNLFYLMDFVHRFCFRLPIPVFGYTNEINPNTVSMHFDENAECNDALLIQKMSNVFTALKIESWKSTVKQYFNSEDSTGATYNFQKALIKSIGSKGVAASKYCDAVSELCVVVSSTVASGETSKLLSPCEIVGSSFDAYRNCKLEIKQGVDNIKPLSALIFRIEDVTKPWEYSGKPNSFTNLVITEEFIDNYQSPTNNSASSLWKQLTHSSDFSTNLHESILNFLQKRHLLSNPVASDVKRKLRSSSIFVITRMLYLRSNNANNTEVVSPVTKEHPKRTTRHVRSLTKDLEEFESALKEQLPVKSIHARKLETNQGSSKIHLSELLHSRKKNNNFFDSIHQLKNMTLDPASGSMRTLTKKDLSKIKFSPKASPPVPNVHNQIEFHNSRKNPDFYRNTTRSWKRNNFVVETNVESETPKPPPLDEYFKKPDSGRNTPKPPPVEHSGKIFEESRSGQGTPKSFMFVRENNFYDNRSGHVTPNPQFVDNKQYDSRSGLTPNLLLDMYERKSANKSGPPTPKNFAELSGKVSFKSSTPKPPLYPTEMNLSKKFGERRSARKLNRDTFKKLDDTPPNPPPLDDSGFDNLSIEPLHSSANFSLDNEFLSYNSKSSKFIPRDRRGMPQKNRADQIIPVNLVSQVDDRLTSHKFTKGVHFSPTTYDQRSLSKRDFTASIRPPAVGNKYQLYESFKSSNSHHDSNDEPSSFFPPNSERFDEQRPIFLDMLRANTDSMKSRIAQHLLDKSV